MEDNEEEDFDDHFPGNAGNDPSNDLGQALHNVQADCESETETLKFHKL